MRSEEDQKQNTNEIRLRSEGGAEDAREMQGRRSPCPARPQPPRTHSEVAPLHAAVPPPPPPALPRTQPTPSPPPPPPPLRAPGERRSRRDRGEIETSSARGIWGIHLGEDGVRGEKFSTASCTHLRRRRRRRRPPRRRLGRHARRRLVVRPRRRAPHLRRHERALFLSPLPAGLARRQPRLRHRTAAARTRVSMRRWTCQQVTRRSMSAALVTQSHSHAAASPPATTSAMAI